MTAKQPPAMATWILKHFGCGPNNDTLMGDLAEQYQQKDSAMWYWRQALKAVPISLFREIRAHKLIAARALVTGWGIWILYLLTLSPLFFGRRFSIAVPLAVGELPGGLLRTGWTVLWTPVLSQGPMPGRCEGCITDFHFSYLIGIVSPLIVWAICGGLVAWRFREQRTAMVLLFAGSNLLMALLLIGPLISTIGPWHRIAHPFIALAANAAASVLGILLGGGLVRDKEIRL
jgi:hypothetical protein